MRKSGFSEEQRYGDMSQIQNLTRESRSFDDRQSLLEWIRTMCSSWHGRTSVMAGHHMLSYRPESDSLVPLMCSIALADGLAMPAEVERAKYIGDFPEASFEMAVRLICAVRPHEMRIALLVNDHQFQSFQENAPRGENSAALKARYYRENENPPEPLWTLMKAHNCGMEVFERNDVQRTKGATLPSNTIYYSENVLIERFKRHRIPWLIKQPGFRKTPRGFGHCKLVYRPPASANELHFADLDRNDCLCSGIMIEFLLELQERGASNALLFVPDECRSDVEGSIEALMTSLSPFSNVVAVWGGELLNGQANLSSCTAYKAGVYRK